jgi:uncharacterized Zn finger protein (UPF0148 family)
MRMLEPQAASDGAPHIQRACPTCEGEELKRQSIEEEEEELQKQPIEEEEEELQAILLKFNLILNLIPSPSEEEASLYQKTTAPF